MNFSFLHTTFSKLLVATIATISALFLAHTLGVHTLSLVKLDSNNRTYALLIFMSILLLSLPYCIALLHAQDQKRSYQIVLIGIATSAFVRGIWCVLFDSQPISDFWHYWECGETLLKGVSSLPLDHKCLTLYGQRALLYTYPIHLLFGKSLSALEFVNIILITLATYLWYASSKHFLGTTTAGLSLLVLFWHPDIWYAITVPTNDIPTIFILSLFFYVLTQLIRNLSADRIVSSLLSAVLLGGCITGLNWIKGLGSLLTGSLFLLWLGQLIYPSLLTNPLLRSTEHVEVPSRSSLITAGKYFLFLLTIPFFSASLTNNLSLKAASPIHFSAPSFVHYVSSLDVFGSNRNREMSKWRLEYVPLIPEKQQNSFSLQRALHEITSSPKETLTFLVRKSAVLSRLDGYISFARQKATEDYVGKVNATYGFMQKGVFQYLSLVVIAFALLGLFCFHSQALSLTEAFVYLFSLAGYTSLVLIAEVQPRYDMFCCFALSALFARGIMSFQKLSRGKLRFIGTLQNFSFQLVGGTLVLIASVLVIGGFFHYVSERQSGGLLDMRGFVLHTEDPSKATLTNTFREIRLDVSPSNEDLPVQAENSFLLDRSPETNIDFFLTTSARSCDSSGTPLLDSVRATVSINESPVVALHFLSSEIRQYFSVDLQPFKNTNTLNVELSITPNQGARGAFPNCHLSTTLEYLRKSRR